MNVMKNTLEVLSDLMDKAEQHRLSGQSPVFNVEEICDLPYLSEGLKVHLLDLYFPKCNNRKLPVILTVHGGGWIRGSKDGIRPFGMYLASKGFCVVNVDYTLAKENDLRTQVVDLLASFRWVLENAESYNMDTEKVFLCGESSGAHLALLTTIINDSDTLRSIYQVDKVNLPILGLGLSSPITNLNIIADRLDPRMLPLSHQLFGEKYHNSPYFFCSSIQNILKTDNTLPPVFFVSSEEDVLRKQSLDFSHLLTKRHVEKEFIFCPPGNGHKLSHAFNCRYPEYTESMNVNQLMIEFFNNLM